jgi:hypothetical protein
VTALLVTALVLASGSALAMAWVNTAVLRRWRKTLDMSTHRLNVILAIGNAHPETRATIARLLGDEEAAARAVALEGEP